MRDSGNRKMRNKKWAQWLPQPTDLRSFQAIAQQGEPRWKLVDSLHWGDGAEGPGQDTGETRAVQKDLEIAEGILQYAAEYSSGLCVRKLPKARGRTTQKDYREQGLTLR